jgi:hypothetical protein
MTPAALTSHDRLQKALGKHWRSLHLLTVPALGLATLHTLFIGSHYLGELVRDWHNWARSLVVVILALSVFALRWGISRRRPPEATTDLQSNPAISQEVDRDSDRSAARS